MEGKETGQNNRLYASRSDESGQTLNLAGIVTTCLLETATIMVSCCIVMLYTMF